MGNDLTTAPNLLPVSALPTLPLRDIGQWSMQSLCSAPTCTGPSAQGPIEYCDWTINKRETCFPPVWELPLCSLPLCKSHLVSYAASEYVNKPNSLILSSALTFSIISILRVNWCSFNSAGLLKPIFFQSWIPLRTFSLH